MPDCFFVILPLLIGWLLDLLLGDPSWLPHPVVGFGKMIAFGERHLNKGGHRKLKGAMMSVFLIVLVFAIIWLIENQLSIIHYPLSIIFDVIAIFYCLAGTTLIREVREVFHASIWFVQGAVSFLHDNRAPHAPRANALPPSPRR